MPSPNNSIARDSPLHSRVGIVLATLIVLILCATLNLKSIHGSGYYYEWPQYRSTKTHTITITLEIALSIILLGTMFSIAKATVPIPSTATYSGHNLSRTRFFSSLTFGSVVMVAYILITCLVDDVADWHSRIIATWSVLWFWFGFAVEAVFHWWFDVVSWLARCIEGRELENTNLELSHAAKRDTSPAC